MDRQTWMNSVSIKLGLLSCSLFLWAGIDGCSPIPLSAAPINSQVVDAETGKPIAGAVVVAGWMLRPGSLTGDSLPCGTANVEEAVTGKDGRFHLPGWGPKWPPCGGTMTGGEPMIFVYKSGYYYGRFFNGDPSDVSITFRTSSTWGNRQMKLKPFHEINYQDTGVFSVTGNYSQLNIDLGGYITDVPTQCNWKKIPLMLVALEMEREKISRAVGHPYDGITGDFIYNDQSFEKVAPKCGSPRAFLEGLLNETNNH